MTRIAWAPDGSALVTCTHGALRLRDATGRIVRELAAERVLDARWLDDGRILALDDRGTLTWHADGVLVDQRHMTFGARRPLAAQLAGDGGRFVGATATELFVATTEGRRVWGFRSPMYGVYSEFHRSSLGLSHDGRLFAMGFDTRTKHFRPPSPEAGRGWFVVHLESGEFVAQQWTKLKVRGGRTWHAFDRTSKRFAYLSDEAETSIGVIRLSRAAVDRDFRRIGCAGRAIALDNRGVIAAYALDRSPRLRVDYLSPDTRGPASVEVLDSIAIDPRLPDLVALAVSADSRRIACLAGDGSIDVVPVP